MAGRTRLGCGSRLGAVAMTDFTRTMSWDFNFFLDSRDSFFKRQCEVVTKILAAAATTAPPGSSAEKLAEYVPENILESSGKIEATAERATIAKCGMTKLIILRALLRIG